MKNILSVIFVASAVLFVGILMGMQMQTIQEVPIVGEKEVYSIIDKTFFSAQKPENKKILSSSYQKDVQMHLPAVSYEGFGIMTTLSVSVKPGEGNMYFNFNNLLMAPDTEQSIRNAIYVASDVTNISISNLNFYYSISDINASMLEGPSAGAAFAIATISALEGKKINPYVIMTGSLNHDGTLGLASGIKEKATIAKQRGANLFLVPYGMSKELNFTEEEHCQMYGVFEHCQMEYTAYWIDYEKEAGIPIKEIKTIQEAMKEFFA